MVEITGTEVIRQTARNRARENGLARLASDLHLSLTLLDEFVYRGGHLPSEALRLLATDLFAGHAEYDPVVDLLRPTNRAPAIPGGMRPPTIAEMHIDKSHLTPRVPPKTTAKPQPARPRRRDGRSTCTHKTGAGGMSALGAKRKGPIGKPR